MFERGPLALSDAIPTMKAASPGKRRISLPLSSPAPSELADGKSAHDERTRYKLYGRRKGPRLSAHQSALFETLLPQFTLTLQPERDPHDYFSPVIDDVWLEVGFGSGEHLL